MRDVLVMLLIAAFFALCVAYVWWCDRIIGPDPAGSGDNAEQVPHEVPGRVVEREHV